ncbi:hypothetical protein UFOVP908_158 [uncultured Caudovirales phage]|uniref:Uncharacterized protein n=1 Tax=uncultured Caudovirales phage TaxID=2100421 RepID=A0A6J5RBL3_9CAUD|nr:hypothetical protein UFOVP908_158 [uncultured Caudovirales phage]CAB4177160.1 hypothetical protein UFOVP990_211 [uncultured Caudovirales phage]CAB4181117.1 hypothetical protein UFOVP1065_9 [uncultured Caudovirales phage]CAB4190871.1 hypothetical protein UFOVP1198_211 [uncultured Caudovirales phage]CAB4211222.1 hypothetical protein UFOVP1418_203 [uncultured Caudovirales phage]
MAHFTQLNDDSIVLRVLVVNNDAIGNLQFPESEPVGVAFCQSIFGNTTVWKQTSYNANFRKNYAGIGFNYDSVLDAFIAPKPYPSWTLNTETCRWKPPVPHPNDGKIYTWDEDVVNWVERPTP